MSEDGEVETSKRVNFEEFRVYLETAERTTDRRLELIKSNASLAILIMAGIGAIASWAYGKNEVVPFATIIVGAISFLAALFCRWWWRQLVSYKQLNSAKFEVLNQMAPLIVFAENIDPAFKSYEPFRREWEILKRKQSLEKFGKGFALSASLSEITVPVSFMASFFVIFATCLAMIIIGRYDLVILTALGLE